MQKEKIALPTSILSIKNFLVNSIAFFLPIYFADIGFSGWQIGILLSVFAVTSLFSSFLAGLLSDRYPIKFISIGSFVLLIIYLFGLSTTVNFWIIFALFFIGGLGNNVVDIALKSFVLKVIKKKKSGKKLAFFNSITTIASGVGALLGGLFIANYQFKSIFVYLALLFLVAILFAFFIKKLTTFKYSIKMYRGDLWNKKILFFLVLIFIFTTHWGAEGTSYALLLKENFGLSQTMTGVYVGASWIIFGFLIYFVGRRIKDADSLKKILYMGLVLSGLGHILFIYPNFIFSFIIRIFHELGDAAFEMFILVGIHRHFPTERIGGTSGVVLTVTIAGKFFGSLIYGPIGDSLGYHYPFIISGVLTLMAIGIAYFYFRETDKKDHYIDLTK